MSNGYFQLHEEIIEYSQSIISWTAVHFNQLIKEVDNSSI